MYDNEQPMFPPMLSIVSFLESKNIMIYVKYLVRRFVSILSAVAVAYRCESIVAAAAAVLGACRSAMENCELIKF